jgi:tRNA nucleotidyltransferase (CCA-adding enzyme)
MWRHFHHEADVGIIGLGETLEQAYEEAAVALTAVITDPETVTCRETVTLACEAPDTELLLVDWLNAIVYEMATRRLLFRRFHVELNDNQLHGTACGEPVDVRRHQPAAEVKGATYTALKVHQDANGIWHAQCVVDV